MTDTNQSATTGWRITGAAAAALLAAGISGFQVLDGHLERLRQRMDSLQISVAVLGVEIHEAAHASSSLFSGETYLRSINAAYAKLDCHNNR